MFVAHGAWRAGTLCLWAEDPGAYGSARGGGAPKPHPYAVPGADLPGVLAALGEPGIIAKGAESEAVIRLPGSTVRPEPSPDLVVPEHRPSRGMRRLAPWRVPVLVYGPAEARELLAGLAADDTLGGDVLAGAELRYLAVLAADAADLVRRGRMLPALLRTNEAAEARWRCVLTGPDAERARTLAAALPPVLRGTEGAVPGSGMPGAGGTPGAGGAPGASERPSASGTPGATPAVGGTPGAGGTADTNERLGAGEEPGAGAKRAVGGTPGVGEEPAAGRESGAAAGGAVPSSGDLVLAVLDAFADAEVRARVTNLLVSRTGQTYAHRWARALTGAGARVGGPAGSAEADALAAELDGWRAAAHAGDGPVRAFFRLAEPSFEAGVTDDALAETPWKVELGLQSTDDPSLVIPAEAVWRADPDELGALMAARPEETLLAGLGRAARLYPDLDAALRTATPHEVSTDAAGAYRFLKETAPLLSAAGFGVQLPRWAGATKLGRRLTAKTTSAPAQQATVTQGFGRDQIIEFRWDLALGDTTITADELLRLSALKVPLVRLRGQWVELDDRQLKAALDFLEQRHDGTMTTADALSIALLDDEDDPLPLTEIEADGPLGDLLSGETDRRLAPVPTPEGLDGELRPYQQRGLAWLTFMSDLGLGTILADDMGLGKTIQTLGLVQADVNRGVPEPTLLVCPMSLVGNWQREAARFTPGLRVYVHHGGQRSRGADLAAAVREADLVITTYGTAARDQEELAGFAWRRVVVDEAQAIKNAQTRQARAVRSVPAGHRLALTGTPVENHLTELWSIMEFANPGLLGPAAGFRRRFAKPIEADGDSEASARLKRATGPFVLRRVKTDRSIIDDLPEKQEIKVWCNLTQEQASLYQATVDDMMARLENSEGIEYRGLVLATMAKLKQVCNHPAHLLKDGSRLSGRSGKLARLEEIVDEVIEDGDKALCFTQYAEFGAALQPYLAARTGRPVLFLHGGLGKAKRDDLVARFNESDEPAIFLLSLKAGGTGLNLTAASHVIHVDRWWNPAVEDQATDRAFRIGQRRNVQVRKFICVGTLEERIDEMIERKKKLAETIVGTGEDWLTSLSTGELREVVRLAPEAVSS